MSDQTTAPAAHPPPHTGGLRRELRFWETIALSIAIMAPTAAMALNGTAPAGLIGHAVPLGATFPYSRFWIVVAAWLLTGLAIILASPRLAARIGTSLAADEGLAPKRL